MSLFQLSSLLAQTSNYATDHSAAHKPRLISSWRVLLKNCWLQVLLVCFSAQLRRIGSWLRCQKILFEQNFMTEDAYKYVKSISYVKNFAHGLYCIAFVEINYLSGRIRLANSYNIAVNKNCLRRQDVKILFVAHVTKLRHFTLKKTFTNACSEPQLLCKWRKHLQAFF